MQLKAFFIKITHTERDGEGDIHFHLAAAAEKANKICNWKIRIAPVPAKAPASWAEIAKARELQSKYNVQAMAWKEVLPAARTHSPLARTARPPTVDSVVRQVKFSHISTGWCSLQN